MPLDLTPLTLSHLLFFGGGFIAVYTAIGALLLLTPHFLRRHQAEGHIYFAGAILVGVIGITGFYVLEDIWLRMGLLAVSLLTIIIGLIDEQVRLSPGIQLVWQIIIASVAATFGWVIQFVSNPFGEGVFTVSLIEIGPWALPGAILTVLWLVFLMNAINWLDGIDGLAVGVSEVALVTLAAVTLLPSVQDGKTLTLAALGAGSVLGFLVWNFAPARVYLGTIGSWFLGLYIGMVAIVGGGKIATTLLVLALPVVDVLVVLMSRSLAGQAPWRGDRMRHLHHRLRAFNISPRVISILGILVSAVLGVAAITLQTEDKIVAFIGATAMLVVLSTVLVYKQTKILRHEK